MKTTSRHLIGWSCLSHFHENIFLHRHTNFATLQKVKLIKKFLPDNAMTKIQLCSIFTYRILLVNNSGSNDYFSVKTKESNIVSNSRHFRGKNIQFFFSIHFEIDKILTRCNDKNPTLMNFAQFLLEFIGSKSIIFRQIFGRKLTSV